MVNEHFITEHIATLKSCVIDASKEIMDVYESDDFGEINKSDGSPLTLADKRANELILERLKSISSSIPVISEETFNQDCLSNLEDVYWSVDPFDGTKEFSEPPRDDWAVHVALAIDGFPIAGAVAIPELSLIFSTRDDFLVQSYSTNKEEVRIALSRSRPPSEASLVVNEFEGTLVEMGSAGAKAMAVVRGEVDMYIHSGGQDEWDNCAPAAVAAAAAACTAISAMQPAGGGVQKM